MSGRPLEQIEMFGGLGHEGHALDSGRTGADDADPLAGQAREIAVGIPAGDVIVPAAGMKTCAGKGFDAGDAGQLGTAVKTGRRYDRSEEHTSELQSLMRLS